MLSRCQVLAILMFITVSCLFFIDRSFMNEQNNPPTRYLSSRLAWPTGLGNHIFELASLVGISRTLNRTAVYFIENEYRVNELAQMNQAIPGLLKQFVFVNGTAPTTLRETVFNTRCCIFQDPMVLKNIEDQHLRLSGQFYQSYKYFPGMRDELRSWIIEPTQEFKGLPKSDNSTHVTCIHTRRRDFIAVGFQASDTHFIREAWKYIANDVKKPISKVVIFGDDVTFMSDLFVGAVLSNDEKAQDSNATFYISRNSPSDDIIYSKSNCDVVLITASHSTFGWWIGYVSAGNTVFYMDMTAIPMGAWRGGEVNTQDYFLPHWTSLKLANDNSTIIIGNKK